MYILNIVSAIKRLQSKKFKDLIFKNYYQRMEFLKENSYHSMKHLKK